MTPEQVPKSWEFRSPGLLLTTFIGGVEAVVIVVGAWVVFAEHPCERLIIVCGMVFMIACMYGLGHIADAYCAKPKYGKLLMIIVSVGFFAGMTFNALAEQHCT